MHIKSLFSSEAFVGVCLAMILLTGSRFMNGIGPGEIGLAIYILTALVVWWANKFKIPNSDSFRLVKALLTYAFVFLLPVTIICIISDVQGTTFRDYVAYLLSFFFLFALSVRYARLEVVSRYFVYALILIVTYKYMFGGADSWYSDRFTAGAKNPNQLALYIVCAFLLVVLYFPNRIFKCCVIFILLFYGIKSLSDALHAYLAFVISALILTSLFPRKYFLPGMLLMLLLLSTIMFFEWHKILDWAGVEWVSADEGDARVTLYIHGLQAWLSTPFSFLFGNGAGSFSGLSGPFGGSEAHDTPIDTLTIGGVIGLYLLFRHPVRFAVDAYQSKRALVFACGTGLLIFSLFHYVARHPIFWFAIFALAQSLDTSKQKVDD